MNRKLTYGLATGSLIVALYYAAYRYDPYFMLGPLLYWSTFALIIAAMIIAALKDRNEKGSLEFQDVLKVCFSVFVISNLVYYAFYYIIFTSDPALTEVSKNLALRSLETVKSYTDHAPGSTSINEIEKQYQTQDYGVHLSTVLSAFAQGAIGGFLISLILAFILKSPDKQED